MVWPCVPGGGFVGFFDLCVYHFHQIRTSGHYFSVFFLPLSLSGTWRTVCLSGALSSFGLCLGLCSCTCEDAPVPVSTGPKSVP